MVVSLRFPHQNFVCLVTENLSCFRVFFLVLDFLILLLLVFCGVLKQNKFTLEMDSDVCDSDVNSSFVSPNESHTLRLYFYSSKRICYLFFVCRICHHVELFCHCIMYVFLPLEIYEIIIFSGSICSDIKFWACLYCIYKTYIMEYEENKVLQ